MFARHGGGGGGGSGHTSARACPPNVCTSLQVCPLPGKPGETIMQGLDSLGVRCAEYHKAGARFCKWRSPLSITASGPSELAVQICCTDLARYALICQEHGLVPIVEPDVSMTGDHDLEKVCGGRGGVCGNGGTVFLVWSADPQGRAVRALRVPKRAESRWACARFIATTHCTPHGGPVPVWGILRTVALRVSPSAPPTLPPSSLHKPGLVLARRILWTPSHLKVAGHDGAD